MSVHTSYMQALDGLPASPQYGWVPTAERLPIQNGRYAIIYKQGSVRKEFIADYDDFYGWNCKLPDAEITHWLKLPDMPNA